MAVTDWKTPSTTESVDRDGKNPWNDPERVQASDDERASCIVEASTYSDWLRCTNFGFALGDIPSGSTIDGIEVKVERKALTGYTIKDSALYLRKTACQVGDNKAEDVYWVTSDTEVTYGGAEDTWNSGLTDADIRDSGFGIDFSARNTTGANRNAYVDCVWTRIYYTSSVGYCHGLKVQGEGELALCDVGNHPLRIRKGGTTYGIELVDTSDGNASRIRIKTGTGVKAIRKYMCGSATEEQTQYDFFVDLATGYQEYGGQKLTISNRTVKKLGFWLKKYGNPTGDITFEIRKVSDDSLINSKVWGDAGDLTITDTYEEVEFDTPQTINEEVRILVYSPGDLYGNNVRVGYLNDDVKADECYTYGKPAGWHDKTVQDFAYRYTYSLT